MPDTFNFQHQAGSNGKINYRIREVKFGDGYSLAVQDGLNNIVHSWTVTVKGGITDLQAVKAFYDAQGGATSFYWTPPGESAPLLFRAKNITINSLGGGVYTIAAEFEQVFKP